MTTKQVWSVALILLIAFTLRLVTSISIHQGISYEEARLGWRVDNLLHFGVDERGTSWPLIFSNGKDLELPVPTYLSLLSEKFGENLLTLRLPFILFGVLMILGAMRLALRNDKNKFGLAILVGLVLSINAWSIWMSSTVSPEIIALTFVIWGAYLMIGGSKQRGFSVVFFLLALLSSKIGLFFLPAFFVLALIRKNYYLAGSLAVIWLSVLGLLHHSSFNSFKENDFSLFSNSSITPNINRLRGIEIDRGNQKIGQLFFNRLFYLAKVLENFFSVFNISDIFARGDRNSLYTPANYGSFLLPFVPAFLIGLYSWFRAKFKHRLFWGAWLIGGILPILFVFDPFQINRLVFLFIPITFLIAFGLYILPVKIRLLLLVLAVGQLILIGQNIVVHRTKAEELAWNKTNLVLATQLKNFKGSEIWLTDSQDPDIGVVMAYLMRAPYSSTNLPENSDYKNHVSVIGKTTIGNLEQQNKIRTKYDYLVTAGEEYKNFEYLLHDRFDLIKLDTSRELNEAGYTIWYVKK